MSHPSDRKETVEVVNVHLRVLGHKRLYGVVIMYGVARADKLVSPSNIVDHLSVVRRASER